MNLRPPVSICLRRCPVASLGVTRRRPSSKRNECGRKKKKSWSRHGRLLAKLIRLLPNRSKPRQKMPRLLLCECECQEDEHE